MNNIGYPRPHFVRDSFQFIDTGKEVVFELSGSVDNDIILLNCSGSGEAVLNGYSFVVQNSVDVTSAIVRNGENRISFRGDVSRAWLEGVPKTYLRSVYITPLLDENRVRMEFELSAKSDVTVEVYAGSDMAAAGNTKSGSCELMLSEIKTWSPEAPFLYDVILSAGKDIVKTYFGLRKISVNGTDLMLNNRPYLAIGTSCTDIASVVQAGFNMIKTTARMEDEWYAECDKKGVIVWQDSEEPVSGYSCVCLHAKSHDYDVTVGENGDMPIIAEKMPKNSEKAFVFVCCKKRAGAFFSKGVRLVKKGAAAVFWENDRVPSSFAKCSKKLVSVFKAKNRSF